MISSVRLKNIHTQYRPTNFSLNIENLEFHNRHIQVIVGPNGSGKSTLLKLIALLDKPDEGGILFNNRDVFLKNNLTLELRKKMGFIMQNPYLFNTTVFENVALGLKIRRYSKDETISKVKSMLATLKIERLAKMRVKYLSRGEYQKVAIAQVLVLEPEIILIDEGVANIDAQSTLSIEETMKDIQKKFNSVMIMTTHSLPQAYRISPEVISIREGRIIDFVHENVFFGDIKDFTGGLQCMNVSRSVEIIFSTEKRGKGYIAIDPENIIISKVRVNSSARNTFRGKITKIESLGLNVRVLVDVGVQIYSIITKQSFEEMGINLGSGVYVSFKVNSVKVI